MSEKTAEMFAKWIEVEGRDYPVTDWPLFAAPRYTQKTITERIEPWASQYDQQSWKLPWDCSECGGADPQFYTPTPLLIELEDRLAALRAKGFRDVPNPDYDPERAEAYWEKQRNRFNQTTIYVGQSYAPVLGGSQLRSVDPPLYAGTGGDEDPDRAV